MALSRKQMEETILRGGAVLHNGRLITKLANLPAAAELAQTDEEIAAAEADLDAQAKAVADQKAKIADKKSAKSAKETKDKK